MAGGSITGPAPLPRFLEYLIAYIGPLVAVILGLELTDTTTLLAPEPPHVAGVAGAWAFIATGLVVLALLLRYKPSLDGHGVASVAIVLAACLERCPARMAHIRPV